MEETKRLYEPRPLPRISMKRKVYEPRGPYEPARFPWMRRQPNGPYDPTPVIHKNR